MPSEAEELAELKSMFSSPPKKGPPIPINRRPAWDDTPLRNRPSALIGIKPVTREPWAIDEDVYNRKFETRDVGIRASIPQHEFTSCMSPAVAGLTRPDTRSSVLAEDRYLDKTARTRQISTQLVDYMCRFDNKYAEVCVTTRCQSPCVLL